MFRIHVQGFQNQEIHVQGPCSGIPGFLDRMPDTCSQLSTQDLTTCILRDVYLTAAGNTDVEPQL